MPRIAIIGAGSIGFAQTLIKDVLSFEALRDSHISLMDIDPERLDITYQVAQKLFAQENLPTTVSKTLDRAEALEGADYVMCAILANGLEPFENEINIPYKYGITQPVGDTMCVGGIFRALRTIPKLLEICRDIERLCPQAWMLNYTNPMTMLTWACSVATKVKFVGLCHGVQGTGNWLGELAGLKPEEIKYWAAGINHMAWFLRIEDLAGRNLWPAILEKIDRDGVPVGEKVRWDLARHIGYFMTESSGHLSEYLPYYRKRPDLVEAFDNPGGFAGQHAQILESYREHWLPHAERTLKQIRGEEPIPFGERSHEYASNIINSLETGAMFRFNGNVLNHGLISNLTPGACVEVPCMVDNTGVHPCVVGDLPPVCAALNQSNLSSMGMAVQAALTGDRELAYHAVLTDPLTAAMLAPGEIRAMFDELFAANRQWMPEFA
ncbi:MAG TPA: alpha-galactosidase [Armatimonadota bacterium]|jgi:alpha-galactosidase